jgi:O-antigen ligase
MILVGLGYLLLLVVGLVRMHLEPDRVLALTVGGIGLVALILRPYVGIHAFIALVFFEDILPSEGDLTVVKLVGGVILTGWILSVLIRRRLGFRLDAFVYLALAFVTWTFVSSIYALDAEIALTRVSSFVQLVLAALMILSVVDRPSRIRGVYWSMVLWAYLSTVVAIPQYYLGITPVALGFFRNRHGLAMVIDLGIVFAYFLYQTNPGRAGRLFLLTSLPVFFLGLALTLSRTGFIMLGVALLTVWYRIAREKRLLLLLSSMAALCIITYLLPDAVWKRAGSIVPVIQRQQETFGLRVRLWEAGIRMIRDRPVFGVGPGNYMTALPRYSQGELTGRHLVAHNAFISVAADMGLIGLGLFVAILVRALIGTDRARRVGRRTGSKDLEFYALAAQIALILVMTQAVTNSCEAIKFTWAVLGMAACVEQVAWRRILAERSAAPAPALEAVKAPGPWGTVPWFPR